MNKSGLNGRKKSIQSLKKARAKTLLTCKTLRGLGFRVLDFVHWAIKLLNQQETYIHHFFGAITEINAPGPHDFSFERIELSTENDRV